MSNLDDRIASLKVGDVIHWQTDGHGRQTVIKDVFRNRRRFGLIRLPDVIEIETWIEPTGYPERGSLYQHPMMCGQFSANSSEIVCPLSYGVFKRIEAQP